MPSKYKRSTKPRHSPSGKKAPPTGTDADLNLASMSAMFSDENKAREFIESRRWPDGVPVCPHCGQHGAYRITSKPGTKNPVRPGLYKCKACRKPFSVRIGTIFEESKIPLCKWLMAIHLMTSSKKGISSHQIARELDVTVKTGWFLTHRIRECMDQGAPLTTVGDLFIPRLGIRPGNKPVFMVADDELSTVAPKKSQRRFFRPVADRIENGQIKPSGYIFYPYAEDGSLLLKTEDEVKAEVPEFYRERLRPNIDSLKNRVRYREWWEPTRPVTTWLAEKTPRIVSQQFGRAGNFALDSTGEFAVVQGVGWEWRGGTTDRTMLLAYLGLLTSAVFDRLITCFSQGKRGGQYELTQHFIERIPLPRLKEDRIHSGLAKIGEAIFNGEGIDSDRQQALALAAYGLSGDGTPRDIPQSESLRSERLFRQLSKRWMEATGFHSRIDRKISHPLYREIIAIGPSVIPALLRDMRDDPGYWSAALTELTGEDPVPEGAETLDEVAAAWVAWGQQHGYEL